MTSATSGAEVSLARITDGTVYLNGRQARITNITHAAITLQTEIEQRTIRSSSYYQAAKFGEGAHGHEPTLMSVGSLIAQIDMDIQARREEAEALKQYNPATVVRLRQSLPCACHDCGESAARALSIASVEHYRCLTIRPLCSTHMAQIETQYNLAMQKQASGETTERQGNNIEYPVKAEG